MCATTRAPGLSVTLLAVGFLLAQSARAGDLQITTELVVDISPLQPVYVTHAPGDTERLFVLARTGEILIVKNGTLLATPFLDISHVVEDNHNQQGMLCMTFDPDYQANGYVYVNYTREPDGDCAVARYDVSADPDIAELGPGHFIMFSVQPGNIHNFEWIGFGPDGYLYVATGDGPGEDEGYAQNTDVLFGKLLRLDVHGDDFPADTQRNYAIPPDNPFVGGPELGEIWAYGLRNPWRCSFDRVTGDLYIGDVGAASWEEVNFQPSTSTGGENYGFTCMEANQCYPNGAAFCTCNDPTLSGPMIEYAHDQKSSNAVIGGFVYRGCALPQLTGAYIFADRGQDRIWALRHENGVVTELEQINDELGVFANVNSFGEDALGELYICDNSGIYRIVSSVPPDPDCNANSIGDACDIASGYSTDRDLDGIPDECAAACLDCDGSDDGFVDTVDFLTLLSQWTQSGVSCDFDGGGVGATDFLALLAAWGACP